MAHNDTGDPKDGYDDKKDDQALIAEAKAFYRDDIDYEANVREQMQIDIRMADNQDHWEKNIRKQRDIEKRPSLTVPRYNQFLNQIKNEQRQNKASIMVSPRGAKSEDIQKQRVKAAKNRQGLIRFIQYGSQASDAYQTAYDFAVECGRGFFRIDTEYVSPESFDLKIVINRIPNPLDVVMDRYRQKIDYSDCKHGFILNRIPREVFKNEYPDAMIVPWNERSGQNDEWSTKDDIWIVEYFTQRNEEKTLISLDDGETMYKEDVIKEFDGEDRDNILNRIENERKVKIPYVMWYKLTSLEVLDDTRIPGKFIPIIPVIGQEKNVVGRLQIKGLMRDLRDSIRSYNYWASLEMEVITLAPKAPYIAAAGQLEGYEKIWATANTKSHAFLPYKPISSGGKPVPPPQRTQFAGVPAGIVQGKINVIDDQKAITGLHSNNLGEDSQGKSGRAILAQQRKGDTSNFHYIDNERIAIAHAGVIINDWLPEIYDTERIEKILGEDGSESTINVNGQDEKGEEVSLGDGEFDIVVTMGPSNDTQRQAAAESMMQFLQTVPQFAPYIADLLAKNMDWPGAQEIAGRLKKLVPPEVLEEQGGEEQMAQQLQQAIQKIQSDQQLLEQMQQMIQELEEKAEGNELDSDTKIKVAQIKARADLSVAQIKAMTAKEQTSQKYTSDMMKNLNGFTTPNNSL